MVDRDQWIIAKAVELMIYCHGYRHRRKYAEPGQPADLYIVHPAEVARLAVWYGLPAAAVAAAYLHDTVEDSEKGEVQNPITVSDIQRSFADAPLVAELVEGMTDQCHVGNRAKRKADERARLASGPPLLQSLKLLDCKSNTPTIVMHGKGFAPTYLAEVRALYEDLTLADPTIRADFANHLQFWEGVREPSDGTPRRPVGEED